MNTRMETQNIFRRISHGKTRRITILIVVILLALAVVLGIRVLPASSSPGKSDLQRGWEASAIRYQGEANAYLAEQADLQRGREAYAARYQGEANMYLAEQANLPRGQANANTSPAAVINWNKIAQRTAVQVAKMYISQSEIYMAYVQAAVYDAVVSIQGHAQFYAIELKRRPHASIDAAVAAAAYDILVHYFPAQQDALNADYSASLAAIPDSAAKTDGIQAGQEAAAGIIAFRQGDGVEANTGFSMPAPAIGVWQLPAGQTPQTPWLAKMRPFLLEHPDQFRPGPPPALTSQQWADEYNEIKSLGGANSTTRTAEQTDIARFFSGNAVVQYNTSYAEITQSRGLDALQAARLYAMGNLVGADAGIACFDAKYSYLFWRPAFAIPLGDMDGNPATAGDPTWKPLLATPNHPEYPAAHGCMTSAQAEVFAAFLGTDNINIDLTSNVPNLVKTTRHYQTVNDLVTEVINARVWGGLHYRESVVQGATLGRQVADWSLVRYFQLSDQ